VCSSDLTTTTDTYGPWIDDGTGWQYRKKPDKNTLDGWKYEYRKAGGTGGGGGTPGGMRMVAGGGLITGGTPGRDSVKSLLMPGEFVIKKNAVDSVGIAALNNLNRTGSMGGLQFSMPINVEGNLDKTVLPDIEKIVNKAFEKMNSSMYNRGFKRTANVYSV
jgi:hypothetical protein